MLKALLRFHRYHDSGLNGFVLSNCPRGWGVVRWVEGRFYLSCPKRGSDRISSCVLLAKCSREVPTRAHSYNFYPFIFWQPVTPLPQVDTVVWCTGYNYSLAFLEGCNLLTPPVTKRVHPLYEQLFHVQHPSLSFIGLPQRLVDEVSACIPDVQ